MGLCTVPAHPKQRAKGISGKGRPHSSVPRGERRPGMERPRRHHKATVAHKRSVQKKETQTAPTEERIASKLLADTVTGKAMTYTVVAVPEPPIQLLGTTVLGRPGPELQNCLLRLVHPQAAKLRTLGGGGTKPEREGQWAEGEGMHATPVHLCSAVRARRVTKRGHVDSGALVVVSRRKGRALPRLDKEGKHRSSDHKPSVAHARVAHQKG